MDGVKCSREWLVVVGSGLLSGSGSGVHISVSYCSGFNLTF